VLDLTINLGNILTISSFLIGGTGFVFAMRNMIAIIAVRLEALEKVTDWQTVEIRKLSEVLITLGRYEERFLRVEGMVDDLRHGRGFIKPEH
jgi:hypothetical protein